MLTAAVRAACLLCFLAVAQAQLTIRVSTGDAACTAGDCDSLASALSHPSIKAGTTTTITVESGLHTGSGWLDVQWPNVTGAMTTLTLSGAAGATVDLEGQGRMLRITDSSNTKDNTVIDNLTIENGNATLGAVLHVRGAGVTVSNTIFNNGIARFSGGAIYVEHFGTGSSNEIRLDTVTFSGGAASVGGGISVSYAPLTGISITCTDNTASSGVCINAFQSSFVTLTDMNASDNTAVNRGGVLAANNCGSVSVTGGTLHKSGGSDLNVVGGIIDLAYVTTANINGVTFTEGFAEIGAAISLLETPGTITACNFDANNAVGANERGAIAVSGASSVVAITGCTLTSSEGGGVYIADDASVTMTLVDVTTGGPTPNGGGIRVVNRGFLTADSVRVLSNEAVDGGGVYIAQSSSVSLSNATISQNSASRVGSGFYCDNSQLTIRGSRIEGNSGGGNGAQAHCANNGGKCKIDSDVFYCVSPDIAFDPALPFDLVVVLVVAGVGLGSLAAVGAVLYSRRRAMFPYVYSGAVKVPDNENL